MKSQSVSPDGHAGTFGSSAVRGHPRLRDLGIVTGSLPTGPNNAISDVPGVWVGHTTLIVDLPQVVRTGVTVVVPRGGDIRRDNAFAGFHSFNGCGEMTGALWIEESGLLTAPIALTDTTQVGLVRDALIQYAVERFGEGGHYLGVVGETWGGWLHDRDSFALTREHVFQALDAAAPGPVAEGNVGGGTAMISYDFKAGIGTASRLVDVAAESQREFGGGDHGGSSDGDPANGIYTVGVLVQSNHGSREQLVVDGVPVGRRLGPEQAPLSGRRPPAFSSLLVIIATDAPLLPVQCQRLARRAAIGMARTGATGYNGSGDLFLAFATGNHYPVPVHEPRNVLMLPHQQLNPLFDAVVEATEEAILNSLVAAETMTGVDGRTAYALPHDELARVLAERLWLNAAW